METSSIIQMIKDKHIKGTKDMLVFMDNDTDALSLLQGITMLGSDYSTSLQYAVGWAAVYHQDVIPLFAEWLTDADAVDTIDSFTSHEESAPYICKVVDAIVLPELRKHVELKFATANTAIPKLCAALTNASDDVLGNGIRKLIPHVIREHSMEVEEFKSAWAAITSAETLLCRGETHWTGAGQELSLLDARVSVNVEDVKAEVLGQLGRISSKTATMLSRITDVAIQVELVLDDDKAPRKVIVRQSSDLNFTSGTRYTTRDVVKNAWGPLFQTAAVKFAFGANIQATSSIPMKHIKVFKEDIDIETYLLETGEKALKGIKV